jgi:hypothetical protein
MVSFLYKVAFLILYETYIDIMTLFEYLSLKYIA